MSLSLSLNNALSGLKANQQAISVLSHNISNANTDGYSRQIVDQSALYLEGVGSGVRVDDVIRKVDKYLQRAVQTQGSEVARTNVVNDYYERVQVLLGNPGAQNSLDAYMTGFFNTLQSLSATPERTSARSDVVAAATGLANEISGLAYDLNDLRFEADREMREAVTSVNDILRKLDALNVSITTAGANGQSTAGLLDERDGQLRELSSFLDITTSFDNYGAVNVIVGDGVSLIDGTRHELQYNPTSSAANFVAGASLNALTVITIDASGKQVGNALPLISGSVNGAMPTSTLKGGKIEGLRLMRDDVIPAMLDQMDQLSANLRDSVNAIHNDGSGFPAANQLTGTRPIIASQAFDWSGSVRIAVLNKDGQPISAGYADEAFTGLRPLTLNLATLNSGTADGRPTMQTIVDEINNHFRAPSFKAELGNINNIELVSDTQNLMLGVASQFSFDFDLENITGQDADFFVSDIRVRTDASVDITNVVQGAPKMLLQPSGAYTTTGGSNTVTLNLQATATVKAGDFIYVGPPAGADVNGIPAAAITGYFKVTGVNGNSITFEANAPATLPGTNTLPDGSGAFIHEPYDTIGAGEVGRTRTEGTLQVDLSGAPLSTYYDITATVATVDSSGILRTGTVTYRVPNNSKAILNDRFVASSVTGDAQRVAPQSTQDALRAILVDANGNEVRKINGEYEDVSPSYLKLIAGNSETMIAIDEMDSKQLGDYSVVPQAQGTGWGFSHFFGLNDFFAPNKPTPAGETVKNSAYNLAVSQRLVDNPNLISTGDLVLQNQSADPVAKPQYTYVRYSGDNQLITKLSGLNTTSQNFAAAGGLPAISLTLNGYASEMLGYISARSAAATDSLDNATTLYEGFKTRSDAISGVNLDEELANTVIFQNSYSATARIVTVVNQMFEDILQMV